MAEEHIVTTGAVDVREDSATIRTEHRGDIVFDKATTLMRNVELLPGAVLKGNVSAYTVKVSFGSQVIGNIYGRNEVSISLGGVRSKNGEYGGVVEGAVVSSGKVIITEPQRHETRDRGYIPIDEAPPFYVKGNIQGDTVTIGPNVTVFGNVVARARLVLLDGVTIYGFVASLDGAVEVGDRCVTLDVFAEKDVTIGKQVTIYDPCIWSRSGSITLAGPVRLIYGCVKCPLVLHCELSCGATEDPPGALLCSDTIHCPKFLENQCPGGEWPIITLTERDIRPAKPSGSIVTPWWRAEVVDKDDIQLIANTLYRITKYLRELPKEGIRDKTGNLLQQKIMIAHVKGDVLFGGHKGDIVQGDKTQIRDSLLTRSKVGSEGQSLA